MSYLRFLTELMHSRDFGVKAATLSAFARRDFPVPAGFGVTSVWCHRAAAEIQQSKNSSGGSSAALQEIQHALQGLCPDNVCGVAVRSSAFVEDLSSGSAAGLYHSVFCLNDPGLILETIVSVSSQPPPSAALGSTNLNHPVLVQRLVPAKASGVCFSRDFRDARLDTCLLEASLGLGLAVVEGRVIPDHWVIRGPDAANISSFPGLKDEVSFFDTATGRIRHRRSDSPGEPVLTTTQVCEIAKLARLCEKEIGHPVDIEWAIDAEGRLFLLQARPITALS